MFTDRTQAAQQALRANQNDAAGQIKACDAHVVQACQRGRGVVGVQGGQHQVTGLRCLDCNICRRLVPDFTDHEYVRVLPQQSPERGVKRQAYALVDIHLVGTGQDNFRRVFDGSDIHARRVQVVQAGVQGHGFARSGRAGDQNHAIGFGNRLHHKRQFGVRQTQCRKAELVGLLVQNPQHNFFAMQGRQTADPHIHHALVERELHATVLRQPFLGNVQTRLHLDTRNDLFAQSRRRRRHFIQHAIPAYPHPQQAVKGLEVYVGGLQFQSLEQQLRQPFNRLQVLRRRSFTVD